MCELLSAKPFHGSKLTWRDVVLRDLRTIGFDSTSWYSAVQDRGGWYDACQTFASESVPTASGPVVVAGSFVCECGRMFRRHGDLIRHHNFCDTHTHTHRHTHRDTDTHTHTNFSSITTASITSFGVYMHLWAIFRTAKRFDLSSELLLLLLLELFGALYNTISIIVATTNNHEIKVHM